MFMKKFNNWFNSKKQRKLFLTSLSYLKFLQKNTLIRIKRTQNRYGTSLSLIRGLTDARKKLFILKAEYSFDYVNEHN